MAFSGAEDNVLVNQISNLVTREVDSGEEFPDRLLSAQVIVTVADSVLRQGMRTLLSELPLWATHAFSKIQSVDFGSVSPARSVLILADADSVSVQWSEIPISCKVLILVGDLSRVDLLAGVSRIDGFLLQSKLDSGTLADAVLRVLSGDFPIPSEVARKLLSQGSSKRGGGVLETQMTERQHETLILLSEGLSNRQIGQRLRISEHGAKRLVASVLAKLDAPNRASAVAFAMRKGIL